MKCSAAPISVIIPCRNGRRWLDQAIQSALAQTAAPIEVIVVDDASTDGSAELASSFGSPVRVVPCRGRGSNAARRTGVLESRGEWIALVDADDIIEPQKHERQLAALSAAGPQAIAHTGSIVFWDDASRPPRERGNTQAATGRCTRVIFESNPICGASVMFRRSLVLELGNYDPQMPIAGDYLLWLVASTRCDFVCVPGPLYRIRRHAGNLSNRRSAKAWYHWMAQEKFRRVCPAAFAALPTESVQQFMSDPVIRAAKSAYWRRDAADYRRLLRLAVSLAPNDPELRMLWRRRWCPMSLLKLRDRLSPGVRLAETRA